MIAPSKAANSIQEYYFSKKLAEINAMKDKGINVINLGIGSPDLSPPKKVLDVLSSTVLKEDVHSYQPYRGIDELRNSFAKWYNKYFNVDLNYNNEILPLFGSKAGIMHISLAFLNEGDGVLVPNPAYPAYASVSKIVGANVLHYNLSEDNNWYPNFKEIEQKDLSKVKIMWVNYPNMPTGRSASNQLFKDLIDFGIKHNILIINDNPYSFILNENYKSILSVEKAFETAIELNSLSKSHNIAGWRMAAVFGNKYFINEIQKIQSNMNSGMFLPIQKATIEALNIEDDWYVNLNRTYKKRRKIVREILDKLNCKYSKTQGGMFVWARVPSEFKDGFEMSDYLLKEHNVFITPGGIFGSNGNNYIRISLCSSEDVFNNVLRII